MADSFIQNTTKNTKTELEELLNYLKHSESKPVKILENIGEYLYVIKFTHLNDYDLNLTLQLPADIAKANLVLHKYGNSQKYTETKINRTHTELESYLRKLLNSEIEINKSILVDFYLKANELIASNYENRKSNAKKETVLVKKENKKTKDSDSDSDSVSEKKSSMKTAEDVINRILWDEEINKDYITVGYLDRFLGIKEVLFNLFDWGDIVEADINALAIPRHRIHYFKYKRETIWDKKTRLDNIFGSTGSNTTIHDVIKRLENVNFNPADNNLEEEAPHKVGRVKNVANNDHDNTNPNYFVSIPIKNAELKENLFNLACDLIDSNPTVEKYLVPETSYHITLCTLRIDSAEELDTVKTIMDIFFNDETTQKLFPVKLKFESLEEFYNKVLFVKCTTGQLDNLQMLKKNLLEKLKSVFVNTAGNYYDFVPHLTMFKTKNETVDQLVNKHVWTKYETSHFGNQIIDEISLCKMGNIFELKAYPTEHTIKINNEQY